MYSSLKYITAIVLSCQCVTVYSFQHDIFGKPPEPGGHCVLKFPIVDKHFMPIPYQPNITAARIINPDKDGNLFITHGERFQFSCSGNVFVSPTVSKGLFEVTVKCLQDNLVSYKGRKYKFDIFRCNAVPRAKLTAAKASCNGIENGVFAVGFQTKVPLTQYKVCFNARVKRTLYAWHYVDAPIFKFTQTSKMGAEFVKTEHFGNDLNMNAVYNNQIDAVNKSLTGTTYNPKKIINKDIGNFLIPSRLLPRDSFHYVSEQHATYFYENTAPHWSVFSRGIWRDVERLITRNLSKAKGKHLIVSGTYNSTYLIQTRTVKLNPFVLIWPDSMPVPLFVWKMVYDVSAKKGTVVIGLNNPFRKGEPLNRFCEEIPCPFKFGRKTTGLETIFCCSKESFESVYGQLDPVVYQEF